MTDRRVFLGHLAGLASCSVLETKDFIASQSHESDFRTRGVVLVPEDLTLADWPERAKRAGLTTIGIHHQNSPQAVIDWIKGDSGQRFLETCRSIGVHVEYELHAMKELLPRILFQKNPDLFRMNDRGERSPDANCCVHSERALEIIAGNATSIAKYLRPTTSRYFYWGDDGQPWCLCARCRELSASEQAMLIENRLCHALQAIDPKAQVAHLAYTNTLEPPRNVKPHPRVFLEYAPINRRYDVPYDRQQDPSHPDGLQSLDANLKVFPSESAQVLEYWLDVSRFSHWQRPAVKLPWNRDVFQADVETYRKRHIRHVTTFAVWVDASYQDRFQNLDFINEYGAAMESR